MPNLPRIRKIAIAMLALSFVPFGIATWNANRYNWTPLNHRVELQAGEMRTPEFMPEVDGRYVLYIELEAQRMDQQREDCLLDMEFFNPERCKSIPSVVDLSWTLWSQNKVVADNTSLQTWRASSGGNYGMRREIGRFDAKRGQPYTLAIYFHRDPSELNAANPRLVAESMQDWWAFALEVQGSFALGILVAVIGVIVLIRDLLRPRQPLSAGRDA